MLYGLHVLLTLLLLLLSPPTQEGLDVEEEEESMSGGDSGMGIKDPGIPLSREPSLYRRHGQYDPPAQGLRARLARFLQDLQKRPTHPPPSTWSMALLQWAWRWTGNQVQALGGNLGFVEHSLGQDAKETDYPVQGELASLQDHPSLTHPNSGHPLILEKHSITLLAFHSSAGEEGICIKERDPSLPPHTPSPCLLPPTFQPSFLAVKVAT
ncbi:hypothetical protein BJ684DRAFT_14732 [Piptocephalis cylindrospora]|uniref:Uncharacterized protein n=1 Tax=Piptocephalis cylindrospora TaxID=1907219 RepID=A0A4P9Y791_9FUNG|nr:hypothetical protein BJ684DRAFT_14732 [Piptocephalis cylindrospora]|eukprot:RKP14987.1 hypothetical protein BJ684DRAFT_14732 [Piptocephalis cylindrospora]